MGRGHQKLQATKMVAANRVSTSKSVYGFEEWSQWPLGKRQRQRLLSTLAAEPTTLVLGADAKGTVLFSVPAYISKGGYAQAPRLGSVRADGQKQWR